MEELTEEPTEAGAVVYLGGSDPPLLASQRPPHAYILW